MRPAGGRQADSRQEAGRQVGRQAGRQADTDSRQQTADRRADRNAQKDRQTSIYGQKLQSGGQKTERSERARNLI